MISIVPMNRDNAYDYAKVSSKSWLESYKDILDIKYLESINTEDYLNNQKDRLIERLNDGSNRYLLKEDDRYVGIFRIRPTKYSDYSDCIELGALYILDSVKGKGYGKYIFNYVVDSIKSKYNKLIIGCLEDNPTNNFYKHMGCIFKFKNPILINEKNLFENVYIYEIGDKDEII